MEGDYNVECGVKAVSTCSSTPIAALEKCLVARSTDGISQNRSVDEALQVSHRLAEEGACSPLY